MAKRPTVNKANAAVLEAQGHSRREIAAAVGVSERMITEYREDPDYRARVIELQERGAAELDSFVRKTRESLLKGADKAVAAAVEMLDALDPSGEPNWDVRLEAVRLLLGHSQKVGLEVRQAEGGGPRGQVSQAVIVYNAPEGAQAAIEGTARDA